jgi:hypothetical protein
MKCRNRIDVHHHMLPDFCLAGLADAGVKHSGGNVLGNWTSEQSLELMATAGVATAT